MSPEAQSWTAAAIVAVTVIVFVVRAVKKKSCGCTGCDAADTRIKPPTARGTERERSCE